MRALQSNLARAVLLAGLRPRIGVPFQFQGKTYVPVLMPTPRSDK